MKNTTTATKQKVSTKKESKKKTAPKEVEPKTVEPKKEKAPKEKKPIVYAPLRPKTIKAFGLEEGATVLEYAKLFKVVKTTMWVNITETGSSILNMSGHIEVMLSEDDYNKVKTSFKCEKFIPARRNKYSNVIKMTDTYPDIMTCRLNNREDINHFNALTQK